MDNIKEINSNLTTNTLSYLNVPQMCYRNHSLSMASQNLHKNSVLSEHKEKKRHILYFLAKEGLNKEQLPGVEFPLTSGLRMQFSTPSILDCIGNGLISCTTPQLIQPVN